MSRSHWELHIEVAMEANPLDDQIQRQGASILTDLSSIREDSTNEQVRDALDTAQASRVVIGRDKVERDEIQSWLAVSDIVKPHPLELALSLEARIQDVK